MLLPLQPGNFTAPVGRKRRRRDLEVVERCRCAHDVHSCFVCHVSQITFSLLLLCFSLRELPTRGVSSQVVLFCFPLHGVRLSVFPLRHCCCGFAVRMLETQHLCNVLTSVLDTPDLRSSSAADPGADRCFSTLTSTIDETVTLLRERILFSSPCRRQHGCCVFIPACSQGHIFELGGELWFAQNSPDDRNVRMRSLELHDNKARVRANRVSEDHTTYVRLLCHMCFSAQNSNCFHFPWNGSSHEMQVHRRQLGFNGTPRKTSSLS